MELVSILIPVFNGKKYIVRCLETVKNQTYRNLEVILFDDGSEDNSYEFIIKYKKFFDNYKFIKSMHVGVSIARNELIKHATGEFIFFLDVDDFMSKFTIEHLMAVQKRTHADLVQCSVQDTDFFYVDEKKNSIIELDKIKTFSRYAALNSYSRTIEGPRCVPTGKLYRKNVFRDIVYPKGKIHEDVYVAHYIINNCNIYAILDQKLYYYYANKESIIRQKFNLKKLDIIDAIKDSINFFEKLNLLQQANWMRFRYCITIINLYCNVKKYYCNQKEILEMLIYEFKATIPKVLSMDNIDSSLKRDLEGFPYQLNYESFHDYWYYVCNKQIK